jgi:hypothetical protein
MQFAARMFTTEVGTAKDNGAQWQNGETNFQPHIDPVLPAGLNHNGFALIDVLSLCVTFNDHEGSTKSYVYTREHYEPAVHADFVPLEREITSTRSTAHRMSLSTVFRTRSFRRVRRGWTRYCPGTGESRRSTRTEVSATDICRLARPTGFEPATCSFGGCHSIHLSYGRDVLISCGFYAIRCQAACLVVEIWGRLRRCSSISRLRRVSLGFQAI